MSSVIVGLSGDWAKIKLAFEELDRIAQDLGIETHYPPLPDRQEPPTACEQPGCDNFVSMPSLAPDETGHSPNGLFCESHQGGSE